MDTNLVKQIVDTISPAITEVIKIVIAAVLAAIGAAVNKWVNSKSLAAESQAKIVEQEAKKVVAKNATIAMEQSPDHVTPEEMKAGAVDIFQSHFPDEKNPEAYVELGVAEKNKELVAPTTETTVDLSVTKQEVTPEESPTAG